MSEKKNKEHHLGNRLYTDSEIAIFYLMGRFQRLVKPKASEPDQVIDHIKADFSELHSLALEAMHDKLLAEIKEMSRYIGELEMSAGIAKFAGDNKQEGK